MNITVEIVEKKFQEFNALCFGGQLPPLPVKLSYGKRFLGAFRYKTRKSFFGKTTRYDFALHINTRYEVDEALLDDTILHEMIHYYIYYNGIRDTSPHGPAFRRIMNDINMRFGRHITVSHHTPLALDTATQRPAARYFCVAELQDGTLCIVVCAKTRIFDIYDELPRRYHLKNSRWYGSTSPYFSQFPISRTARLYRVDIDKLQQELQNAVEFEFAGNTFRRK